LHCRQYGNILEAAQAGAISVVSLVANVLVSAFAFLSLISWVNSTFTWLGDRVGIEELTMEVHSQAQQSTRVNHSSFVCLTLWLLRASL
jgi:nucleoside permease NupC